jgi:hypothetical protein
MRHRTDERVEVNEELGGQPTTTSRRQVPIGVLELCIYIVANLRSNYCTKLQSHSGLRSVMALTMQPVPANSVN